MEYSGHISNGVVVLEGDERPPEGMRVKVLPVQPVTSGEDPKERARTLFERFQNIIGVVDDLPSDMAAQHDHYIHGTPKK